jgi:hypothetical protein
MSRMSGRTLLAKLIVLTTSGVSGWNNLVVGNPLRMRMIVMMSQVSGKSNLLQNPNHGPVGAGDPLWAALMQRREDFVVKE